MPVENKKRHVVSYENMTPELAALFLERYPGGYNDYLPDLVKFSPGVNPRTGKTIDPFYAVTIETDSDVFLVKIKVKVDDAEDAEEDLFKGDDEDGGDDSGDGGFPASDDDIAAAEAAEQEGE